MENDIYSDSLVFHKKHRGKIQVDSKVPLETERDLSLAYTPGVSQPCIEISKEPKKIYEYTAKGNLVAVVTDGTSVLGLGDIGPYAAMPVMEGKSILFKKFANIDAFPICLNTKNSNEIIEIVEKISPVFGGILLEDIAAPRCFAIEEELKSRLDIPVFHDDQHGTAIVVAAALKNCLKIKNLAFNQLKIVINGAGAAGVAIAKILKHYAVADILLCDTHGIIYQGRKENMTGIKNFMAGITNKEKKKGGLKEAMKDAHVFIGVSKPNVVTQEMIKLMAPQPILLALSNPIPEIMPEEAKKAGAFIVCTGRSDFPNQVNNVLAFPGIFLGALESRAQEINEEMKLAAVHALAEAVSENALSRDHVIPNVFDVNISKIVSRAVAKAAIDSGVCVI